MEKVNSRESFGSRLGFIVSTIGFSVGVGTLWRFPYVCGTYGGGLYLLTYIIFMIVIGIPLFTGEVSLGMASRQTPVKAYQKLSEKKGWGFIGWLNMICIILVIGYTSPVYGWILHYIYATFRGVFKGMGSNEVAGYFATFSSNHVLVIALILLNCVLTMLVVRNNLQNGIEKIGKILLPSLVVIMIAIVVMGLQLDGAAEGVKFVFSFDFSSFGGESILSALGQTFFSLGIAMAVALTFGSYQKEGDLNTLKNSTIISLAVIFVAVLSVLMIFPLTSAFGLDVQAGPGLTFIVMPNVFNAISGGVFWGTLFYIAFFIAAFSSGIAGWQAVIGFIMDQFGFSRNKAMLTTFLLVCLIGIPATLSDPLFNFFDMITNNIFLSAGAFFMSIFVGWIWGMDKMADTIGLNKNGALFKILSIIIKFVAPLIIIIFSLSLFGII